MERCSRGPRLYLCVVVGLHFGIMCFWKRFEEKQPMPNREGFFVRSSENMLEGFERGIWNSPSSWGIEVPAEREWSGWNGKQTARDVIGYRSVGFWILISLGSAQDVKGPHLDVVFTLDALSWRKPVWHRNRFCGRSGMDIGWGVSYTWIALRMIHRSSVKHQRRLLDLRNRCKLHTMEKTQGG